MSAQVFELLFFAVIAFLVISKLIATLGTTNGDEDKNLKSFFGEKGKVKDVTNSVDSPVNEDLNWSKIEQRENLDDIIVTSNSSNIIENSNKIKVKLSNFDLRKFRSNAVKAFEIIISSVEDQAKLKSLVDKRYIEKFHSEANKYHNISRLKDVSSKISNIYFFGNNVFIKVIFEGKNILQNATKNLLEEWTFTKNLNNNDPDWYLTNIDEI